MRDRKAVCEMRDIKYFMLHHSLTEDGEVLKDFDAIKRYHINTRGFDDIGYNAVLESIDHELVWVEGRSIEIPGAHCKESSKNHDSYGVCIVGNFDDGEDTLTVQHIVKIAERYHECCEQFGELEIVTHTQYAPYKTCPGSAFPLTTVIAHCKTYRQMKKSETPKREYNKDLMYLVREGIFDGLDYWQDEVDEGKTLADVKVETFIAAIRKVVERD